MEKIFTEFRQMTYKTQILIIVCIASILLLLFFGFKNAGSTFYNGSIYDAGSLFLPQKYGDMTDIIWDPNGVTYVNEQVKILRQRNLLPVILFAGTSVIFGYLSWQEEDFKDFLLTMR